MKLEFIGVGEAFAPELGNASVLIHSDSKILVDCGYGVPAKLFAAGFEAEFLDAIYITHFHADHYFGLAAVITRMHEEGRQKPLTLIGQSGLATVVAKLLDAAYPGVRANLSFAIRFMEVTGPVEFCEFELNFAETRHAVRNLAVRFSQQGKCFAISGDGEITAESQALYAPCQLIVHETFSADKTYRFHTSALEAVNALGESPLLETLAGFHLRRQERPSNFAAFKELADTQRFRFFFPEPGDVFEF